MLIVRFTPSPNSKTIKETQVNPHTHLHIFLHTSLFHPGQMSSHTSIPVQMFFKLLMQSFHFVTLLFSYFVKKSKLHKNSKQNNTFGLLFFSLHWKFIWKFVASPACLGGEGLKQKGNNEQLLAQNIKRHMSHLCLLWPSLQKSLFQNYGFFILLHTFRRME